MITTAQCTAVAAQTAGAFSTRELPIPTLDAGTLQLPREGAAHLLTTQIPFTLFVLAVVLAGTSIIRALGSSTHRAIRFALGSAVLVLMLATSLCAGGWGALVYGGALIREGRYEESMAWLAVARLPVRALARHIDEWPSDPAGELRDYALSRGIRIALLQGNLPDALRLAGWEGESAETQRFRTAAYLTAAAQALQRQDFTSTAHHLEATAAIDPELAAPGQHALSMHRAFASIDAGQLQRARQYTDQLPLAWNSDAQQRLVSALARTAIAALHGGSSLSLDEASNIVGSAYERASSLGVIPLSLSCDWAAALEMRGERALHAGEPAQAIEHLLQVEHMIPDAPYTQEQLPIAFHHLGLKQFEAGDLLQAIASLDESLRRAPDSPQVVADQAQLWVTRSWQLAEVDLFTDALTAAHRSESLNPTQESDMAIASTHLLYAEHALRIGAMETALAQLRGIGSRGNDELRARAAVHITYAPETQRRLSRLSGLARWTRPLPRVSGAICVPGVDGAPCAQVALFNDEQLVGSMSIDGALEVLFLGSQPQQYSGARDSDGDGAFDVFITSNGGREVHFIEADGDGRIDRERTYQNGSLIDEKLLSGRVLVRVLSAAIASKGLDPLGMRPDPYFVLSHNEQVVGVSPYISSTYFPDWKDGWAIQFRGGDRLRVDLWDHDSGSADEHIDYLVLTDTLPKSGVRRMANNAAAIELRIDETDLPPNYRYTGEPPGNVFLASSAQDGTVADIIAAANAREASAHLSATALRIAGAEVATLVMAPRTLLGMLGAALLGDLAVGQIVE